MSGARTPVWVEVVGWIGASLVLGAYVARSLGNLPDELVYQGMNAIGSLGILIVASKKRAWQPAVLNLIWLVISAWCALRLVAA
ncbi:MAG: hypothetical protein HZA52_04495 [Planctomycetes bacterium]|nr:hypothetical protein [Planctomycetota bacterium]